MLFEVISGSRAYGTHKPTSDTDYRGVFIQPIENLLGNDRILQVSDETNDITYYEIGRFLQLLQTQNPNIIELFNIPEENIIYKHPQFQEILDYKDKFLSKECRNSFGGYAISQIKKARGLNKKIVNPVDEKRKTILEFCHVISDQKITPLVTFLNDLTYSINHCGLTKINHGRDLYSLFYDDTIGKIKGYRGITNDKLTDIILTSIPKGEEAIATMLYNKDAHVNHIKEYNEYWDWVKKRNPDRYDTNLEHGKGYDSKNMMHCIRLTRMAIEIAQQKKVIVKRPDVDELLKIRNGEAEYDDLLNESETSILLLDSLYENSDLPDTIDGKFVNEILINFRKKYYNI